MADAPEFAPTPAVSASQIWDALTASHGNISGAGRALGIARNKLRLKIDSTPELLVLLDDLRESIVDRAEQNKFLEVLNSDPGASSFILQTLGRNRGYATSASGTSKDPIVVEVRQFHEEPPNG